MITVYADTLDRPKMSFTEARGDKKRRRAETMKRDVLRAVGLLDEEGQGLPCLPGGE